MPETEKPKSPYSRGGGRKPLHDDEKLKQRSIYVTNAEWPHVQEFISRMREQQKGQTGQ